MIGFAVFALFLYFFCQSVLSLLFYLFLWQIKEYRSDRLLVHLKTKTGRRQVVDYLNIFKWKGALRPVPTLKAMIIFILSLFLLFRAWFFFLKHLPFDFGLRVIVASFLTNLLAFFFVSLGVFLLMPVSTLLKKMIILLAKKKMARFPYLLVVGITGSYGKSSTKEFLVSFLSQKFQVLKTPMNWNSEIGVAQTVLRYLGKNHQVFVVEMAAYKEGEIQAICEMVRPKIGILTGINEQHLALFGSLDRIIKTKYELIEALPQDGLAVFNGDNRYCLELAEKTKIKKKLYSLKEVEKVRVGRNHLSFSWQGQPWQLSVLGKFNLANFLAAFWVARTLGVSRTRIARGAREIQPLKGTMAPFIGLNAAFFIDDTYSSNPDGFAAALDYLKKRRGKRWLVTPGIIELGEGSAKIHRQLGRKMAEATDTVILTKKDSFLEIQTAGAKVVLVENPEKILAILEKEVKKEDTVLLEGRLPEILMKGLK